MLTQSVDRVPLEQSAEQRLGLGAQELRHSQASPVGGETDGTWLRWFQQIPRENILKGQ